MLALIGLELVEASLKWLIDKFDNLRNGEIFKCNKLFVVVESTVLNCNPSWKLFCPFPSFVWFQTPDMWYSRWVMDQWDPDHAMSMGTLRTLHCCWFNHLSAFLLPTAHPCIQNNIANIILSAFGWRCHPFCLGSINHSIVSTLFPFLGPSEKQV